MSALLWAALAWADVHSVDAEPRSVVVFADRARVTRTATLDLPAGEQEIVFVGLPSQALTEGITADARGNGVLRGIDLKRIAASQIADERVAAIQQELEKLYIERQTANDEMTAANAWLTSTTSARTQAAKALSAQMLYGSGAAELTSSIRSSLSADEVAARKAWRAAAIRTRDIGDKVSALERERDTLGSSATDTLNAVVHLDLSRAGRVEVDLSYLVMGASWVPRYDLRGNAETGKVELALSAMVSQTSGEDWGAVKLTVSSAKPGLGTSIPMLDPFWLERPRQYYDDAPRTMSVETRRPSKKAESVAAAPMAEPEYKPMEVAQAAVSIELAATAFTVSRPEDVDADGTERKVLLTTENLDAKLEYVIVPRLDPRAYLVGKVKNTASFPLLPGTAGVFLSGAYLGDMQLATVAPGESFDVAFGADDRVSVRRTPKKIQEGKNALIGKRATSTWEWDIRVRNGHKRAIEARVSEQIPISTREDVKVERLTSVPEPKAEDNGVFQFPLSLAAGAESTIHWGYSVTYPTELNLGWME